MNSSNNVNGFLLHSYHKVVLTGVCQFPGRKLSTQRVTAEKEATREIIVAKRPLLNTRKGNQKKTQKLTSSL